MSQPGFAGNSRIVDINGDAGAFIPILAQSVVRRLRITESPLTSAGAANPLQGSLEYQIPNDDTPNGFTTIFETAIAVNEGLELGSEIAQKGPWGEIIGQPGQPQIGVPNGTAATTMIKVRSGTATATSIVVTEFN